MSPAKNEMLSLAENRCDAPLATIHRKVPIANRRNQISGMPATNHFVSGKTPAVRNSERPLSNRHPRKYSFRNRFSGME